MDYGADWVYLKDCDVAEGAVICCVSSPDSPYNESADLAGRPVVGVSGCRIRQDIIENSPVGVTHAPVEQEERRVSESLGWGKLA